VNARKRYVAIAGALLLVSCGGLPRALRNQIAAEKLSLQQTDRQLQHSLETVKEDLAHSPSLFQGTPVSTQWPARLQSARGSLDRAKNDLQQILGLTADPLFSRVYKWKSAMAQYTVGHLDRLARIDRLCQQLPGIALAGNAYRGIGVPDCVRSGAEAANRILQALGLSPLG